MTNTTQNGLKRYLVGVAATVSAALVLQSGALIYWAGCINTRVTYVEDRVELLAEHVHVLETE